MIFPEEESLHNLWPIKALQSTVCCYHNRSVYFLLLLVNVVRTIGILHDVLVCCNIVTVVLLLPFSDFLTLSLLQGLFFWTKETLYKVRGLAPLFFSHFWNLPSFCQSVNNPFTPMSDQDRISHYNINTISTRYM